MSDLTTWGDGELIAGLHKVYENLDIEITKWEGHFIRNTFEWKGPLVRSQREAAIKILKEHGYVRSKRME